MRVRLIPIGLAFLVATVSALAAPTLEQHRQEYLAGIEALRVQDEKRYREIHARLEGYVLQPQLEYEYLKDRLAQTSPEKLRQFLDTHKESAAAEQLRRRWLHQLADRGKWDLFLENYQDFDDDNELRCYRLGHLQRTGADAANTATSVGQMWLNGNKLPAVCEELFGPWRKAGHLTQELVWARIKLAMERRNLSLAEHLASYLDAKERVWVGRWTAMHRDPGRELARFNYAVDSEIARMVVRHGVMRMGHNDPVAAMAEWQRLKQKHVFSDDDERYVMRMLGILAAQTHLPEAADWLGQVNAPNADETVRQWRVRAAIRFGQWEVANYFLSAMSEVEQKEAQWRYWRARVWERLGLDKKAQANYAALANERGYYGFLAADRLKKDYSMQHVGTALTPEEVSAMLARRGIQIAQELFNVGDIVAARRQWAFSTRRMNNRELQTAAVIAAQWGWHDRAILTMSKTDNLDDLELRFPILYRQMVEDSAQANRIDAGWVYGVMRQESAFVSDARSPVGALGLMQLMPQTGRMTGRALKLRVKDDQTILKIENNLRLGAHYLKLVLDQHRGHHVLATAAYNAGPNRLKDWLPENDHLDADVWVDTIPFTETRNYVKNVLSFTAVYDHRLGNKPVRLQQRMPPVAPRG